MSLSFYVFLGRWPPEKILDRNRQVNTKTTRQGSWLSPLTETELDEGKLQTGQKTKKRGEGGGGWRRLQKNVSPV